MSSDIPYARYILSVGIADPGVPEKAKQYMRRALVHMVRKTADFRAVDDSTPMTAAAKERARVLRDKGWSIRRIAEKLHTNSGRVSEACSNGG